MAEEHQSKGLSYWILQVRYATNIACRFSMGLGMPMVAKSDLSSSTVLYLKAFTGFHECAEFTTEDVGTSQSGLNLVVLANNDETVLIWWPYASRCLG
ncbi:hypothetical protein CCACVL1_05322 [Corchorus capsularis]|uniref:4-hydroxyphenylpyruvate dioxygenase n=1 Tax=Corchorus capsularis TaxID=210143 RepID=A0A1R3JLQ5_COCAP|nr:hypothetical protein CCACVL1_05322 [Corchorus capsularis]